MHSKTHGLQILFHSFGLAFLFLNGLSLKKKFIYFLAVLGLYYCAWAFSSCGVVASHCTGFSFCRMWASVVWHMGSGVVVSGL